MTIQSTMSLNTHRPVMYRAKAHKEIEMARKEINLQLSTSQTFDKVRLDSNFDHLLYSRIKERLPELTDLRDKDRMNASVLGAVLERSQLETELLHLVHRLLVLSERLCNDLSHGYIDPSETTVDVYASSSDTTYYRLWRQFIEFKDDQSSQDWLNQQLLSYIERSVISNLRVTRDRDGAGVAKFRISLIVLHDD